MFSAFKRLAGKIDNNAPQNCPPSHQTMSGALQKKFSKGVQYNMKIIIKGDRNVGKSCLLERLQGKGFIEEYVPTDQIQVASIQWAFKATDDIVKVEVWDVVDRGKSRPQASGLKLSLSTGPVDSCIPVLDAEFLDVYKGTHGVVLMMDVTKNWTFEYICKELVKVPPDLPVLILGNHCDMSHHRTVTNGQVTSFIENFERSGDTLYAESSMRNGFGLHLLHRFLGLPFLRLQKLSLELLLERNKQDTETTKDEIQLFQQSDESNYNKFLENLAKKRRQIADHNSKVVHIPSNTTLSPTQENITESKENSLKNQSTIAIGAGHPIVVAGKPVIGNTDPTKFSQIPNISNNQILTQSQKPNTTVDSMLVNSDKNHTPNIVSKSSRTSVPKNESIHESTSSTLSCKLNTRNQFDSVEDFCPDDCLDKSFLDDVIGSSTTDAKHDSDSDAETGNPLVATFQEEIDYADELSANTEHELYKSDNNLKTDLNSSGDSYKISNRNDNSSIPGADVSDSLNIKPVSPCDSSSALFNFDRSYRNNKDQFETDSLKSEDLEIDFGSDDWVPDSKVRGSPEGGEDSTGTSCVNQGLIESTKEKKEEKKHKKSKKSKDKDDKERKRHSKKHKKKRDELEHFLNGSGHVAPGSEGAYEAI